jgi:hypothetical protein
MPSFQLTVAVCAWVEHLLSHIVRIKEIPSIILLHDAVSFYLAFKVLFFQE